MRTLRILKVRGAGMCGAVAVGCVSRDKLTGSNQQMGDFFPVSEIYIFPRIEGLDSKKVSEAEVSSE